MSRGQTPYNLNPSGPHNTQEQELAAICTQLAEVTRERDEEFAHRQQDNEHLGRANQTIRELKARAEAAEQRCNGLEVQADIDKQEHAKLLHEIKWRSEALTVLHLEKNADKQRIRVLTEALETVLPRLAHNANCMVTLPTSEWAARGSMVPDNCKCEISVAKAALDSGAAPAKPQIKSLIGAEVADASRTLTDDSVADQGNEKTGMGANTSAAELDGPASGPSETRMEARRKPPEPQSIRSEPAKPHPDSERLDRLEAALRAFKMEMRVSRAPAGNPSIRVVINLGSELLPIRDAIDEWMYPDAKQPGKSTDAARQQMEAESDKT